MVNMNKLLGMMCEHAFINIYREFNFSVSTLVNNFVTWPIILASIGIRVIRNDSLINLRNIDDENEDTTANKNIIVLL